ncbi:hypothetical protein L208DRAFT_1418141 [Tricholoma matsutake]|nr:hypothetical protein L208DRAFT_1418141 [Tricholoma matsutake 945]
MSTNSIIVHLLIRCWSLSSFRGSALSSQTSITPFGVTCLGYPEFPRTPCDMCPFKVVKYKSTIDCFSESDSTQKVQKPVDRIRE